MHASLTVARLIQLDCTYAGYIVCIVIIYSMNGVRKVGTTSVCSWVVSASRPSHRICTYVVQVARQCTQCVCTGYLKRTPVQYADTISTLKFVAPSVAKNVTFSGKMSWNVHSRPV